jgi:hypothetical protein
MSYLMNMISDRHSIQLDNVGHTQGAIIDPHMNHASRPTCLLPLLAYLVLAPRRRSLFPSRSDNQYVEQASHLAFSDI